MRKKLSLITFQVHKNLIHFKVFSRLLAVPAPSEHSTFLLHHPHERRRNDNKTLASSSHGSRQRARCEHERKAQKSSETGGVWGGGEMCRNELGKVQPAAKV
jgi:hypothetical protein